MIAHDIGAALNTLSVLQVTPSMAEQAAGEALRPIAQLNGSLVGVSRFAGRTPWERHTGGDELVQVVEGEIKVTLLAETGPVSVSLSPGMLVVVPRGTWHRQEAPKGGGVLFATVIEGTEMSWEDDPRTGA